MPGLETLPSAGHRDQQMDRYSGRGPATADQLDPNWKAPDDARELAPAIPTPEQGIAVPEAKVNDDPIRIVLASLDQNVDAFAREAAHEKRSKKAEKGPLWRRTAKSVWDNLTREYQIVKATGEARREIIENNNLRHHQGESDAQWREHTVMRYGSDYGDKLIHEGETFHDLNSLEAGSDPNAMRIREDITDLLRQRAKGDITDDDSFEMMLDRTMEAWKTEGVSQNFIGEGQLMAHNVGEMSNQVIAALDSAEGLNALDRDAKLEEILANIQIVAGEARVGSQVEINSTLSERLAEKLQGVPFLNEGRIARVTSVVGNELFVASVLSAAMYTAKRGVSAAGKVVVPGLGAGIVAAMRERRSLIDERALTARRADAGLEIDPTRKAQVEMAAAQYESRPAGELLDELSGLYNEGGELNIHDRDGLEHAMQLQAEINARNQISDRSRNSRLINYADASPEEMAGRRFDLDLAMAKLEVDMRSLFANPAERAYLDIHPRESFAQWLGTQQSIQAGVLNGEMSQADRRFNKLVARRAFQQALVATFVGGAVGYAAREVTEAAAHAYGTVQDLAHNLADNAAGQPNLSLASYETPIGPDHIGTPPSPDHIGTTTVMPDHIGSQTTPDHIGSSSVPDHIGTQSEVPGHVGSSELLNGQSTSITETSKIILPEGYTATTEGHMVTITGPDGRSLGDVALNPDGSLSAESEQALNNAGLNLVDHQETVLGKPEITHPVVSQADFARAHEAAMVKIHHTKWFDNDTSRFDLNELGTDTYKADSGSMVVDIRSMTTGGSFHGASGVNWQQAASEGHLKVFMSASEGSQAHAFEVAINPDGTATIDQDSPAYGLFDQQGQFRGGFLEVALDGGQSPDGSTNIATLSTVVGENPDGTLTDTVATPAYVTAHTYSIQPTNFELKGFTTPITSATTFTPVIPLASRRRFGESGATTEAPASVSVAGPELSGPGRPESPIAPVVPIRPAGSALPQPPLPMALPAAPSAGPEAGGNAPKTGAVEGGGGDETVAAPEAPAPAKPETTKSDEQVLAEIDAVTDAFPLLIPNGTRGYSQRAMKLATLIYNRVKDERPREFDEDAASYRKRIMKRAMRAASPEISGSPGLKGLYTEAFQLFSQANARSQSYQDYGADSGERAA